MRVLLSTIGSRGDVQPLVALANQLRALNQEVHMCVPPDFRDWIEGLGIPVSTIGPELRSTGKASPSATPPTPEQRHQMIEDIVADQFKTVMTAAQGSDIIVGATGLQIATRSVAEKIGIPYIFAAFCPIVLPSPFHAPPVYGMRGQTPSLLTSNNRELWSKDAEVFNDSFGVVLNSYRLSIGLASVSNVRDHIFTDQPWLAADPVLAPWPDPSDQTVFQSGAWILPDKRPLSPALETFLEAGEPPVYFGFGSIRAPADISSVMIGTARRIGRRAIILKGWADLSLVDNKPDCLAIDEVNQQALFKRVAAVVHHGGAGTTTTAALAGIPQVIIPQMFDQHYWARQIHKLGIGVAHKSGTPSTESLTDALQQALRPEMIVRAKTVANSMVRDGANIAARRLITDIL
jgi:vancomycin aglycone glucosyltransferase